MRHRGLLIILLILLLPSGRKTALASENILFSVRVNPMVVEIVKPANVSKGQPFSLKARVSNRGKRAIRQVQVSLRLSDGLVLTGKRNSKNAGNIGGGHSKIVSWRVKAVTPGQKEIEVEATGREAFTGTVLSAFDTDSLVVASRAYHKSTVTRFLRFKRLFLTTFCY
jgi:hypothetical protein